MTDLKIRDLERPKWADEWLWNGIISQIGDVVIARVRGSFVGVCPCCSEIHYVPTIEQEEHAISLLFDKLGVQTMEPQRA